MLSKILVLLIEFILGNFPMQVLNMIQSFLHDSMDTFPSILALWISAWSSSSLSVSCLSLYLVFRSVAIENDDRLGMVGNFIDWLMFYGFLDAGEYRLIGFLEPGSWRKLW